VSRIASSAPPNAAKRWPSGRRSGRSARTDWAAMASASEPSIQRKRLAAQPQSSPAGLTT
jgi:hypothetical protein